MTMAICIMDFVLFSPTETADEIKLEVRKLQTVLSKLPIAFFISNDELKYFPPYPSVLRSTLFVTRLLAKTSMCRNTEGRGFRFISCTRGSLCSVALVG